MADDDSAGEGLPRGGHAGERARLAVGGLVLLLVSPVAVLVAAVTLRVVMGQVHRGWRDITVAAATLSAAILVLLVLWVSLTGVTLTGWVAGTAVLGVPLGAAAGAGAVGLLERWAAGAEWHPAERRRQAVEDKREARRATEVADPDLVALSPVPVLGVFRGGDLAPWVRGDYVVPPSVKVPAMGAIGESGSGKALALDTPIPTPAGWATMGDLADGDLVFNEAGQPCRVTRAWPVRYDRPCYEVQFSDGSVITADAEHLWQVDRRTNGSRLMPPQVVSTEQMVTAGLRMVSAHRRTFSVRVAAPLQCPDADLPVPPYTLGAWLGDGTAQNGSICTVDQEIISGIESEGCTVTASKTYPGRSPQYRVAGLSATLAVAGVRNRAWRRLGQGAGNKHIPMAYLRASETQRRALLAGLLDTDGTCSTIGSVTFDNTNERLTRDVHHLICGLGYKATLRSKPVRLYGKDCGTAWAVSFTPADKVFWLPRKAARQVTTVRMTASRRYVTDIRPVPSRPVRCITVDSPGALYLAGESCIPTHNTETVKRLNWLWAHQKTRVIFADFKGCDPKLPEQVIAAYLDARPDADCRLWPAQPLDIWQGDSDEIAGRLLKVQDYSEPFYRLAAETAVRLAVNAPGEDPVRDSIQFLARLDLQYLERAYKNTPQAADVGALKMPQVMEGVRMRYAGFFAALGSRFDHGFSWGDADLTVLTIPTLAQPSDAMAAARMVLADFGAYCMARKPRQERVVFVVDEFSAVTGAAPMVIDLAERVRDADGHGRGLRPELRGPWPQPGGTLAHARRFAARRDDRAPDREPRGCAPPRRHREQDEHVLEPGLPWPDGPGSLRMDRRCPSTPMMCGASKRGRRS